MAHRSASIKLQQNFVSQLFLSVLISHTKQNKCHSFYAMIFFGVIIILWLQFCINIDLKSYVSILHFFKKKVG